MIDTACTWTVAGEGCLQNYLKTIEICRNYKN